MPYKDNTYVPPEHGWHCFHCDEHFAATDVRGAREHFGIDPSHEPGCILQLRGAARGMLDIVRDLEKQIWHYQNEDTQLHRHMRSEQGRHDRALRLAEEAGYERALADIKKMGVAEAVKELFQLTFLGV